MIMDKNNMHDLDTWMFFRWIMKAVIAIYFVTNTFNIVMAVFDISQNIVNASASFINTSTSVDIGSVVTSMVDELATKSIPELILITLETGIVRLCMMIISIVITVILYGRMIEIYLASSVAAT